MRNSTQLTFNNVYITYWPLYDGNSCDSIAILIYKLHLLQYCNFGKYSGFNLFLCAFPRNPDAFHNFTNTLSKC